MSTDDCWHPPLLIAHRGASAHAPENTLAAFERAIVDGASAVEVDLRATCDGRVVSLHDRTLDRTTDGSGPIAATPWRDVRRLDAGRWFGSDFAGERVPTLEQIAGDILPRIPCVLQAKTPIAAQRIPSLVPEESRHRVTISSTSLSELRGLDDTGFKRTWIVWWRDWPGWTAWIGRLAARAAVDRLAAKGSTVTPRMIARTHRAGLMLRAWGVGSNLALARHLLSIGIDGMTFDDPARLRSLMEDRPRG